MKKLILLLIVLALASGNLYSQKFGGFRALRIQGTGGFQNGLGLDLEYATPLLSNRFAVRTGFSALPLNIGSLPLDGVNSDFEMMSNTIDFGLKYYIGGEGYNLFIGVDYAMDTKNISITNISGQSESFIDQNGDPSPTIVNGEVDGEISSSLITPKVGWTKISSNGFTWSIEFGYSIPTVDPTTFDLKETAGNNSGDYIYKVDNVYDEFLGLTGIPYLRLGIGYSIRFGKKV